MSAVERAEKASAIRGLLIECLSRLEDEQYETMAWRLADAGGRLRDLLEYEGYKDLGGLDKMTGMGFMLPARLKDLLPY